MTLASALRKAQHSGWQWLVVFALGMLIAFGPLPAGTAVGTERKFTISAGQFEYLPGTIKVNRGDRVSIDFISTDVVHGLAIDGYDIEVTAEPGKTGWVSFVADKEGAFRFRCTVTCGNMHPFMIGKLEVGRSLLMWRALALSGLALAAGVWKVRK